jgi:endonuclease YncB( thermonuclease family)
MLTKRYFVLAIFLPSLFFFCLQAVCFDSDTTHPKLTEKTADFYNQNHPSQKLTSKQIKWLVRGSIEEDSPLIRCRNHFYDPDTRQGLNNGKYEHIPTVPAPEWAVSSRLQSRIWELGDYSWHQAVYSYQQRDYKKAFVSLGHVLHLLQDMGVPAHVRNDAHEAGDPFEEWLVENSHKTGINTSKARNYSCQEPKQCFQELASWTHNNFFSKDSIELKRPQKEVQYLYKNGIRLIHWDKTNQKFVFNDKVHQSYWKHLAPEAVSSGSALIGLFFKKVEGEQVERPETAWDRYYRWAKSKTWEPVKQEIDKTAEAVTTIGRELGAGLSDIAGSFTSDKDRSLSDKESQGRDKPDPANGVRNQKDKEQARARDPEPRVAGVEHAIEEENGSDEKKNNSAPAEKEDERTDKAEREGKEEADRSGQEASSSSGLGVAYVIDGDTIILEDGRKVRYIGVDAPELGEEGREDDEYLAWKSRLRNMELLQGERLRLVTDPNMDKDKYGRLLRYVYIDGRFVNKILAREGMAEVFFCRPGWENCDPAVDEERKQDIINAGKLAQSGDLGVYGRQKKTARARDKQAEKDSKEKDIDNTPLQEKHDSREKHDFGEQNSSSDSGMPPHIRNSGGGGSSGDKNKNREKSRSEDKDTSGGESDPGSETDVFISSFDVYAPQTGSNSYTSTTTVGLDVEITPSQATSGVLFRSFSGDPGSTSAEWKPAPPQTFAFGNDRQGQRRVYIRWKDKEKLSTGTASSTIFLDTKPPSASVVVPDDEYDSYSFPLAWSGRDKGEACSGVETYRVDYRMGISGDWKSLAVATTSTSTPFRHSTTTDRTVFFRARARDRAGNKGGWSDIASTTVKHGNAPPSAKTGVVISEIHTAGTDDWIELYNPTAEKIDLEAGEYRIERSTAGGGDPGYYLQFGNTDHGIFPGGTDIDSQDYYLIVDKDATSSLRARADAVVDKDRKFALTEDNAVYLATSTVSSSTDKDIVDVVGYGASPDHEGEEPAPQPTATTSLQRKALATSTASKMATGTHKDLGNGYDSEDNGFDFVLQTKPSPRATGNREEDEEEDEDTSFAGLAWPQDRHDSQNSNRSQYAGPAETATSSLVSSFDNNIGRLLFGKEKIYASAEGGVYSIDPDSGDKQELYGRGGLVAMDNAGFYLKSNKKIFSISRAGELNWEFEAGHSLRDMHMDSNGDILTSTAGSDKTDEKYKIYKIDHENGRLIWERIGKGTVREYYRTVLDGNDNFYIPVSMGGWKNSDDHLDGDFLVLAPDGELQRPSFWGGKYNNPARGANALVAGKDKIYFTNSDGLYSTSTAVTRSDDDAFVQDKDWNEIHHQQDAYGAPLSPRGLSAKGKLIIFADREGGEWSFFKEGEDIKDMDKIATTGIKNNLEDMVIDKNNILYALGRGKLLALDIDSGSLNWSLEIPDSAHDLIMGSSGDLYFAVEDKGIYKVGDGGK